MTTDERAIEAYNLDRIDWEGGIHPARWDVVERLLRGALAVLESAAADGRRLGHVLLRDTEGGTLSILQSESPAVPTVYVETAPDGSVRAHDSNGSAVNVREA